MSTLRPEKPLSNLLRSLATAGWFAALLWCERKRQLRKTKDSKLVRDGRNLAIAAFAGPVMQMLDSPVAFALARRAERTRQGLLHWLPVRRGLRAALGIVLLDYTLYWWHVLTHRVPFLWRFHQVHHVDREMDATTALRFHFGEMTISIGFRTAQVILIGPTPAALAAWQMFLFFCILFHHSN